MQPNTLMHQFVLFPRDADHRVQIHGITRTGLCLSRILDFLSFECCSLRQTWSYIVFPELVSSTDSEHAAAILICRPYLIPKKLWNSNSVCVHSPRIATLCVYIHLGFADNPQPLDLSKSGKPSTDPETRIRTLTQTDSRSQPPNRRKTKQTKNRIWGEVSASINPSWKTIRRQ